MSNEEIFIITDGCMWEQNRRNKTSHDHCIEVVDLKTGQVRYIKNGSRIRLIEGYITDHRTQKDYNKEAKNMLRNEQSESERTTSKKKSKGTKA